MSNLSFFALEYSVGTFVRGCLQLPHLQGSVVSAYFIFVATRCGILTRTSSPLNLTYHWNLVIPSSSFIHTTLTSFSVTDWKHSVQCGLWHMQDDFCKAGGGAAAQASDGCLFPGGQTYYHILGDACSSRT